MSRKAAESSAISRVPWRLERADRAASPAAMACVRAISSCIGRLIVRTETKAISKVTPRMRDRGKHDLAALAVEMLDDVVGRPRQIDGAGDAAVDDDRQRHEDAHAGAAAHRIERRRRPRRHALAKHAGVAAGKCGAHLLDRGKRAADIVRRRQSPCRSGRAAGSRRASSAACRRERLKAGADRRKCRIGRRRQRIRTRPERRSTARSRLGSTGR